MKLQTSTAHLIRTVPVMALVAAILRLKMRRGEQLHLDLETKQEKKS